LDLVVAVTHEVERIDLTRLQGVHLGLELEVREQLVGVWVLQRKAAEALVYKLLRPINWISNLDFSSFWVLVPTSARQRRELVERLLVYLGRLGHTRMVKLTAVCPVAEGLDSVWAPK
jgi:hypothetical protein